MLPHATCWRPSAACSRPGGGRRTTGCCSPCRSSTPTAWWWGCTAPSPPAPPCCCAAGSTPRRRSTTLERGEATIFFGVPTMYGRLVEELRRRGGPRLDRVRLFAQRQRAAAAGDLRRLRRAHRPAHPRALRDDRDRMMTPPTPTPASAGRARWACRSPASRRASWTPPAQDGRGRGARASSRSAAPTSSPATGERGEDRAPASPPTPTGGLVPHGRPGAAGPADGYFRSPAARDELIISGGFNIYPREIEEVLEAVPRGARGGGGGAAASGLGRGGGGRGGRRPAAQRGRRLVAHCKRQLASFKTPRACAFVAALPRNALGKVQKHLLPPV